MGYHVVDPADLDPEPDRPSEMKYVSEATDLDHIGLRTYRVEPGESIPLSGLHYHDEQEEVFYVREGQLSVETPDRTYTVDPGQFFVAEPGSPHRAHVAADADGECRLLGMGAPPQSDGHGYEAS
ncbi:cupin domain-containing protein [Halomicrobium mukohataei]|uniref:Cupin domain-containing protein n=1 Tax=Halomicrobium mukohataei TaxID=57705 RepID=A0A847TV15_9EURY|nr:cupin domain-containing protein [Halomicrobium mukohataei]NLV09862.1 cupin domain-containing protein [Halomicrobium mukohataei]